MICEMKRQRFIPGSIVKIPIANGFHTYGRLLLRPYIEVFDCKTMDEIDDLDIISRKPVLFTVCFFYRQSISNGLWEIVGKLPFDESTINIPKQYRQPYHDASKCTIVDIFGNETPASIEECRGLERLAVWLPDNIVRRLNNHYDGIPDPSEKTLRLLEMGEEF